MTPRLWIWMAFLCFLWSRVATAEEQIDFLEQLSDYEQGHLLRQMHVNGWQVDQRPEGKRIAFIRLHRYPVFVEFEPLPVFPNRFHVLSKTDFIQREFLVQKGRVFQTSDLLETVRNLRRLAVFNLVAAVPLKTQAPDTVGILIVTRDLWSLRLESAFQITGTLIDRLQAQLTERNLFGRGIQALVRYNLQPLYYSAGALFSNRRLFGKPYMLTLASDVFFERNTDDYEGYSSSVYVGRPLYSMADRFGYGISAARGAGVVRQEQMGSRVYWDDPDTDEIEAVPRSWSYESYNFGISGDLQFRLSYLLRFGGGFTLSRYKAKVINGSALSSLSDVSAQKFRDEVIPESLLLAYPHLRISFFRERFSSYRNLSGFGLSEELQLGFSGGGYAQLPTRTLGSSQDLLIIGSRLVYRERVVGDGLVEWATSVGQRYRFAPGIWTDRTFLLRMRLATPSFRFGRLVSRTDFVAQRDQIVADPLSLGGENGLRGYSSQRFLSYGGQRFRTNIEYRTVPKRLGPFYAGGALFYDAGALSGGTFDSGYVQSIGFGARAVVPQASQFAYRLDLGFPLDGSGFMLMLKGGTMTLETNQAVPITTRDDSVYTSGVGGLANQP